MNFKKTLILSFSIFVTFHSAFAFTLKGKLVGDGVSLSDFTVVAEGDEGEVRSVAVEANGKFTLQNVGAGDRLSLLFKNNYYGPIVAGLLKGTKVSTFQSGVNKGYCESGNATAIMAIKKAPAGKKPLVKIQLDDDFAFVKTKLKKGQLATTENVSVNTENCEPSGVSGNTAPFRLGSLADDPSDPDGDGINNESDIDDDDDGLSDTFDNDNDGDGILDDSDSNDNDKVANRVWNFQQLHLDRENAFNTRVTSVSSDTIDSALVTYGGIAMQVVDGDSVELNCGGASEEASGLVYCTAGGTGRAREPYPNGIAFPDESDSDNDGKGEIQAGPSGDFQLAPGANSSQILPGDTFIEEVTTDGTTKKYAGMINGVVHDVPGVVSIQTTLGTTNFSYPGTVNSIGASDNPILVPTVGDVVVTITTYLPHYKTGAGDRVVPAGIRMISNIPNGPCLNNPPQGCMGGGSGPGLLPGSLYSSPSAGWSIVSDGIKSDAETDTLEGEDTTVTFTVNLTGTGGVTGWDSGEQVMFPIQSADNNGTTAAHNVWFKRQ